jgi:hypothetical protein
MDTEYGVIECGSAVSVIFSPRGGGLLAAASRQRREILLVADNDRLMTESLPVKVTESCRTFI